MALDNNMPAMVRRDTGMDVLYARHWGELCHYIKKHFGPGPPDPEDVAQDTFMKFAAIDDREAIDNPRAYLFRMAHNILVDEHRRLALRRANPRDTESRPASDDRTPERVLVGRERLEILTGCLRAMPAAPLLLVQPAAGAFLCSDRADDGVLGVGDQEAHRLGAQGS